MIIFGTRGNQVIVNLPDGRVLILRYRYFHIFWILRLAYSSSYELATPTPHGWAHQPLPEAEAARFTGGELPKPPVFDRFGLVLILGGLVVFWILSFMAMGV